MNSSRTRRRWILRRWTRATLAYGTVLLATLLASPYILDLLSKIKHPEQWTLLSNIGQSYTGMSTLFSAAALFAVAHSLKLQVAEHRITQQQSVRDPQFKLFELGITDPDLGETYSTTYHEGDPKRSKQMLFLSMRFNYLKHAYLVGAVSKKDMATVLELETFPAPLAREYWRRARDYWAPGISNPIEVEFLQIADNAYSAAMRTFTREGAGSIWMTGWTVSPLPDESFDLLYVASARVLRWYPNHVCIEVMSLPNGSVRVRDSKDASKLPLEFTAREWAAFIAGVKAGEFDYGPEIPARQA